MLFTGTSMGLYHMNSACVQLWLIVQLHVHLLTSSHPFEAPTNQFNCTRGQLPAGGLLNDAIDHCTKTFSALDTLMDDATWQWSCIDAS